MAKWVFDASVVLALLNQEPGGQTAIDLLPEALLGAVNRAEVATKLVDRGATAEQVATILSALTCEVVDFDADMALDAGLLHAVTRGRNVSLGDRCCLALAQRTGLPVLTADRAWKELGLDLDIHLLR